MKAWNFKAKSNPKEISDKLESALGSVDGFVFNMDHDKNDSVLFNFRKRVIFPSQILHRNRIIVNGKILKTATENETEVEISFRQHILITLNTAIFFGLGLFAIILGIGGKAFAYIPGGILLVVGFIFWLAAREKFEKDLKKYKALISEIIEF